MLPILDCYTSLGLLCNHSANGKYFLAKRIFIKFVSFNFWCPSYNEIPWEREREKERERVCECNIEKEGCAKRERERERERDVQRVESFSWFYIPYQYFPSLSLKISHSHFLSILSHSLSLSLRSISFLSLSLSLAESEASIPDISSLYTKFSKLTANKLSAIKGFFTKKLFRTGPKRCRVCVWVCVWVRKGDNVNPLVIGRERKRDREERERLRDGNTKEDSLK